MKKLWWVLPLLALLWACGSDESDGGDMPDDGPLADGGTEADAGGDADTGEPTDQPDAGPGSADAGDAAMPGQRPPGCGNGQLDDDEECDDGNDQDGDGCDDFCRVETSFSCVVAGAPCEECGNGVTESSEDCDDGNTERGDGCDDACAIEPGGWVCPLDGQPCELCGDGFVSLNEVCDEGDFADALGCAEDCRSIDPHFACPTPGEPCDECGDGMVSGLEICDDGNTESGDGCVFNCSAVEMGHVCPPDGGSCTLCGDGKIEGVEECDDGNFRSNDGCSDQCRLDEGAVCLVEGELCAVCGNGVIEAVEVDSGGNVTATEACDEGELADGIGCTDNCTAVDSGAGWQCPVAGLECGRCGDGVVQQIEACDEGPAPADGAGCTDTCTTIEANYDCPMGGMECTRCGNGVVEGREACDDGVDDTLGVPVGGDGCSLDCMTEEPGWDCIEESDGTHISCSLCGNGRLELGEQCDDGNAMNGDGCSADCKTIENDFNCIFPGFPCVLCGNGTIEPGEECDEGHLDIPENQTEGCDDECRVVLPWVCVSAGTSCVLCGDGVLEPAVEECDDGNLGNDDGCSSTCALEEGFDCVEGECSASACGDGFRAGEEECDDGNQRSGDGCSFVCDVEGGFVCTGEGVPCRRTQCGDGALEGEEQCDDGNTETGDGCDDLCQLEPGSVCPVPGMSCEDAVCGDGVVEGFEQCDDGMLADADAGGGGPEDGDGCDATCQLEPGYHCPVAGGPCEPTDCGDGLVQGLEQCDDENATAGDGCTDCVVDPLYRCNGEPSACMPVIELVAIRTFNVTNIDPAGLIYDPERRSFGGYKASEGGKDPIELCLDGTVIDPNDTTEGPYGTIFAPDGSTSALSMSYTPFMRPLSGSVSVVGAAFDPFTGDFLFLTVNGQDFVLTQVPTTFDEMNDSIESYQETLGGLSNPAGLTVGEDGNLYVADDAQNAEGVVVFARERDMTGDIAPVGATSFATSPSASGGWLTPSVDALDAIFTVPGEDLLGIFNTPTDPGDDLYFRFYDPSADPELIDQSLLPGELFSLGSVGVPYTQYAVAAETAADGGAFVVCPNSASQPCQLFARRCQTDSDCSAAVPGTVCSEGDGINFCNQPGIARDDRAMVSRGSTGNVIDVLANDTLSESACVDPVKRIVDVDTTGTAGTVTFTPTEITYGAPGDNQCGFVDTFMYTADLGGGVLDDATVRVVVACICGDGVQDDNEQCDDGDPAVNPDDPAPHNGDPDSKCLDDCSIRIECGDTFVDPGEECDDGNTASGDGCTSVCTLESVCGDGSMEGVEECDDGNTTGGDGCNGNCTLPVCGDRNLDFDNNEQCDDGNLAVGDGCDNQCQIETECGNGLIELGEQCDDGNTVSGDGCSPVCSIETDCGDGTIDNASGEECDPAYTGEQCGPVDCTLICLCENYCGDGEVGGVEECDGTAECREPNDNDGNGPCTVKKCGDGFTDTDLGEQCDDGNTNPADGCSNGCTLVTECGDGVAEGAEECDDGNNVSGDGCSSACKSESAVCGDGVLHFTEQCDDGNTDNGDGCDDQCLVEGGICGDGEVSLGEECDDGANGELGDGCRDDCTAEVCGDQVIDPDEQCDDGNMQNGDGCSSTCQFEVQ